MENEKKKRKVILDVDTGSDDAVAIMSAILSGDLDVLAICTVHGNLPIEYTTDNTLRVVQLLGSNVPVYRGCGYPLVMDLLPGRRVNAGEVRKEHIVNGKVMEVHEKELPLPAPTIHAQKEHACAFLLRTLLESDEKITLIPVGAMTNIATVLRMDERVKEHIDEIICMGGGIDVHNRAYRSETNFYNDPEAAKIMMNSGVKVTVVGLDATHSSWFGYPEVEKLRAIGNPAADFAADMLYHRIYAAHSAGVRKEEKSALHDVLAVCAAIDPTVLEDVRHQKCDVDISGGIADGQLMVSSRYCHSQPTLPTYIAYHGNGEKLLDMLCKHLSNFRKS